MSDNMTRRTAIIASLMALGGTPIYAQQDKEASTLHLNSIAQNPIGIFVSLDTITYLEVGRGKETVRIDAEEIWRALHD